MDDRNERIISGMSSNDEKYVDDQQSFSGSSYDISLVSTRSFNAIPASSVKERSFLVGKTHKPSPVFDEEFHRCFPDGNLHLFIGTWNMCTCKIPNDIDDFLLPDEEEYLQEIYVVGIQESSNEQKVYKWELRLQETLGTNHVLAHSASHGALHVAVFVRRDLIWFCTNFEEDRVTTRAVSQYKTKGACGVSFQCFGTSFLFISSHLASGEGQVKERIENYHRIIEKLQLPINYKGFVADVTNRFDYVYWFGDLNFRLQQPSQVTLNFLNLSSFNVKDILKYDELIKYLNSGKVFNGFEEGEIKFLPTYKFVIGTNEYEAQLRVPSYTDRILFKYKSGGMIHNKKYNSVMSVSSSDHKPLYGIFDVALKPGNARATLGTGKFNRQIYLEAARSRANIRKIRRSRICALL